MKLISLPRRSLRKRCEIRWVEYVSHRSKIIGATDDLINMAFRVHSASPKVPISALVTATLLSEDDLYRIKDSGVDIIGVGLDAVTEDLFLRTRGRLARGPHRWDQHWEIVRAAPSKSMVP